MKKIFFIIPIVLTTTLFGQSYAPAAGEEGSTAIKYDSTIFKAWATHVEVIRGWVDISDKTKEYGGSNLASFGVPENAVGPVTSSTTDAVSLGDSGVAIVTFAKPIANGPGFDFAIFENSFSDVFLELAHVEVSSDGENYVRFPSHSETPTETQVGGFGSIDPTYINNLAGKYRVGYGTPFDLEELADSPDLDINNITHVKIIDVVGSIGEHGSVDSHGNKINDPFPTPFDSGGFDLTGVGVIHEKDDVVGISNQHITGFNIYPNPTRNQLKVFGLVDSYTIYNLNGVEVMTFNNKNSNSIDISSLKSGIYFVKPLSSSTVKKLIIK